MDIKVGAYKVNGEFKSRKHAKEIFLTHYPDVTAADLDTQLDKIFKDGTDKSNDAAEQTSEIQNGDSEVRAGSVKGKSPGRD